MPMRKLRGPVRSPAERAQPGKMLRRRPIGRHRPRDDFHDRQASRVLVPDRQNRHAPREQLPGHRPDSARQRDRIGNDLVVEVDKRRRDEKDQQPRMKQIPHMEQPRRIRARRRRRQRPAHVIRAARQQRVGRPLGHLTQIQPREQDRREQLHDEIPPPGTQGHVAHSPPPHDWQGSPARERTVGPAPRNPWFRRRAIRNAHLFDFGPAFQAAMQPAGDQPAHQETSHDTQTVAKRHDRSPAALADVRDAIASLSGGSNCSSNPSGVRVSTSQTRLAQSAYKG